MNVIINGFHESHFFPLISNILDFFKVNNCYITYVNLKNTLPVHTKIKFHKVTDIIFGNYDVDWSAIPPLDEDFLEKMSDCEVTTMKMMDRIGISDYNKRKRIYLRHLRYWNYVIDNKDITLFLSSSPPHEVYDFVIYSLCKLKNIPVIFSYQIRLFDSMVVAQDWEEIIPAIKEKYLHLQKEYANVPEQEIVLSGRIKRDFDFFTSVDSPVHFYMNRKKSIQKTVCGWFKKLLFFEYWNPIFLSKKIIAIIVRLLGLIKIKYLEKKLFSVYKHNQMLPNLSSKYFYFPLHMQPEATTCPMGGKYVDQLLIVQMLSFYIPKDFIIYIKENPYQSINGRDIEFYNDLLDIPQVRFVPVSYSTFDLIDNSVAVVTATGTAGWEALYRGKSVLLFGHSFYQFADGIFMVRTKEDCEKAINDILKNNFSPNLKDIKLFLKALENTTIEGYIDYNYKKVTMVPVDISNNNIEKAIINKIKSVCYL